MFVQRPDASLFSLAFGQGRNTLLGLGGWVGSGEVWHELFGHLPDWRCVSYDHRGSGVTSHGNPTSSSPITVAAMVDDLFAVMDAHGIQSCVLGAESAGVGVALEAALRAPERFTGLALIDGSWKRPVPGSQDAFIASLRANYFAALSGFVDACLPEPSSENEHRWGRLILQRAPLQHAIELLTCRSEFTVEDHLERINIPALVVHGEADRITPVSMSKELAKRLPQAALHLLPGKGHVPIITAPHEVASLIRACFA